MAKTGWVDMYHPDLPQGDDGEPRTQRVTQRAYDLKWKDKGWKVKGEAPVPAVMRTAAKEGDK
jgi:hypothetical protein